VHVRLTSDGEIEKNEPVDSVRTAHITRLVAVLQVPPETNDVGWAEASRAPARAALSIATWEWKIRARSAPAARRTRKIGMMTASSARAGPRGLCCSGSRRGVAGRARPGPDGSATVGCAGRSDAGSRGALLRRIGRWWCGIGRRGLTVRPIAPAGRMLRRG